MAKPHVSKDTLRAIASLSGLKLGDEKLEELLPQVRLSVEAMAKLETIDLEGIEPALIFKTDGE